MPFLDTRPKVARLMYWSSVGALLALNVITACALFRLLSGANIYVAAVLGANIAVFTGRAIYVYCNRRVLFSVQNYRALESATNAERVGFYAFAVLMGALLIDVYLDGVTQLDRSLDVIGVQVFMLAIWAPMITYLTSGYGKLRDLAKNPAKDLGTKE